ncbi:EI24 domain-containing protein [Crenalkalicoccus roseus]|uniref:EI24 domain-containing protein n=1 Tax=Crenalkalicoccus roseus TaxID=1485588 RepID=UPI001081C106|nr:EI24 domain-containing protein [Crenalkalicoccus roseus]
MPAAFLLTLRQLGDPAFLGPLLKGFLGALLAFLGLAALAAWGVGELAGGSGWLAALAAAAGGVLALGLAVWLFVPVMLAIAGLFTDAVAAAVERRFYPGLPPARGAGLAAQARFNLGLALRMGLLTLLVLPVGLFLPPLGAVLFWAVSAVALGHGLFEGVAQRRMGVAEARALRRRRQGAVLAAGGVLAALALVPGLNLLVPVLGTAAMTHLLHRGPGGAPAAR